MDWDGLGWDWLAYGRWNSIGPIGVDTYVYCIDEFDTH